MTRTLPFETLHGHTVYSDGFLSHKEVLDICEKHTIGIVAFTDHEALLDTKKFDELKALHHSVKFISGVELTFNSFNGTQVPSTESGHIIGLFVDPANKALAEYCSRAQQKRIEKIEKTARELSTIGFSITIDDVSREVKGLSYTKPHLVAALIKKEQNVALLNSLLEKMKKESDPRYENVTSHDITRRVYDLLLGNDPYVKINISDDEIETADFDMIVQLIRGAGGIASIAHWFTIKNTIDALVLSELVNSNRIDGFETRYGFYDPPEMQKDLTDQIKQLTDLSKNLDCITTGGVDLHKPADLKNLSEPGFVGRARSTIGMTNALLEKRPAISRAWSTIK